MHIWAADTHRYPFKKGVKPPEPAGTAEMLVEEMDAHGVDHCVIVQVIYHGWDNDYVADVQQRYPRRFRTHGLIDPTDPHVADRLEYWMVERGLHGMRFSPVYYRGEEEWMTSSAHHALWQRADELGAVFNFLIYTSQLPLLEEMVKRYPRVPVVIDHLAYLDLKVEDPMPEFEKLLRLAAYPRVFCKVSELSVLSPGGQFPYADTFAWVKRLQDAFGVERLMWGTGFPGITREKNGRLSLEQEMTLIQEKIPVFTEDERRKIMGENAVPLWQFGPAVATDAS